MTFKVFYKNIDTDENIQKPITLEGASGQPYKIEKLIFDQYRLIEQTAPLTGVHSIDDKDVSLFYRRRDWIEGQKTELKIKLFADADIYADTSIESKKGTIKADSVYLIDMRVVTPDGSFWYRTENSDWIRYHGATMELLDLDQEIEDNSSLDIPTEIKPTEITINDSATAEVESQTATSSETPFNPDKRQISPIPIVNQKNNSQSQSEAAVEKQSLQSQGIAPVPKGIRNSEVVSPELTARKKLISSSESQSMVQKPKKKLRKNLEFNARIDFVPRKSTAIFDAPYGVVVNKVRHDTKVKITNRIDEPGITWFKIDGLGWITNLYVKGI